MGHTECSACGRIYKHAVGSCFCGSKSFEPACAKCFASQSRDDAAPSHHAVDFANEGSPGYDLNQ